MNKISNIGYYAINNKISGPIHYRFINHIEIGLCDSGVGRVLFNRTLAFSRDY